MDSVHENKPFDTQEAVEDVLNMLDNRNAAEIQVWLFLAVLSKRLRKKYNFKLWRPSSLWFGLEDGFIEE